MENSSSYLFSCGSVSQQIKKKRTFLAIRVTLLLIAIALLAFLISLLAVYISRPDIGSTNAIVIKDDIKNMGDLVSINASTPTAPLSSLVNLEDYENRAKTTMGTNAFTVGNKRSFYGTPEAVDALNKMIQAFYDATKDDNIYIAGAYNSSYASAQNAPYTLGTAFELKYFSANDVQDWSKRDSIYGVELYKWVYENAYKYGFLTTDELYGTDSSSNIFRYVGSIHAGLMKEKKLTLEEYSSWLSSYDCDSPLFGEDYAIYYQKAEKTLSVPEEYKYSVSADYSKKGYIVTVYLSK